MEEVKQQTQPQAGKPAQPVQLQEAKVAKLGVMSVANTLGLVNVMVGLLLGIIMWLISIPFASVLNSTQALGFYGFTGPLSFLVFFPIVNGILGWIVGAIVSLFYNLASKLTKGVRLYSN